MERGQEDVPRRKASLEYRVQLPFLYMRVYGSFKEPNCKSPKRTYKAVLGSLAELGTRIGVTGFWCRRF